MVRPDDSDDGLSGSGLLARVAAAFRVAGREAAALGWRGREGLQLGSWLLEQPLGRGGMGEVWRARRADGAHSAQAAIKLLRADVGGPTLIARFGRERQILAQLDHPGIARLLDAGIAELPWLAMEYVEGEPLDVFAREQDLDLDPRLDLFLQICDAVAHAHHRLVLHRDLKPSNILVDARGRVKLLDFGIAKLLDPAEDAVRTGPSTLTATGLAPMTLAYAAPEQVLGEPLSTATDVYALGVLLYELLTGQRPHQRESEPLAVLADRIREEMPTRPSQVLLRAATQAPQRRLARRLRGDLDLIVMSALHRDPARRPASAAALAEDLRRWRDGLPVRVRPDSASYRLQRFLRRHWIGASATAAVLLALGLGLAVALWQAREARAQAQRAEALQGFLLDIFRSNSARQPDPIRARETTARELLDLGAERLEGLSASPSTRLSVLTLLGELYHDLAVEERAVTLREQAVELAALVHGPASVELARAWIDLASSLHTGAAQAQRGEALQQAAGILDRRRDAPVELRAQLLMQRSQLRSGSDLPAAIADAAAAVALLSTRPAGPALAEAHYIEGVARYFDGDNGAAAQAFRNAIAVAAGLHGEPHPASARFHALLADVEYRLLDIPAALRHARQAREAALAVSGPEHADTLQTTIRLGRLVFDVDDSTEGLALLEAALQLAVATRGADDGFHTLQARVELGHALLRAGDAQAALVQLEAAIETRRRERPGTLFLAQMLEYAAAAWLELDEGDRTESLLDEAAQIRDAAGQARPSPSWNHHVASRARLAALRDDRDSARDWLDQYAVGPEDARPRLEQIEQQLLEAEIALELGDPHGAGARADAALAQLDSAPLAAHLAMLRGRALSLQGLALAASGDPQACGQLHAAQTLQAAQLLPGSSWRIRLHQALDSC